MSSGQPKITAFTAEFNGLAREIKIECSVSLPYTPEANPSETPPKLLKTLALWDTGATGSAITHDLALKLGLMPITKVNVNTANGVALQNVYLVNIFLPNRVVIPYVKVTEISGSVGGFDVLIGMDIISLGDFSITNKDRKTTFSFRLPSVKTIDYVKEHKEQFHTPVKAEKTPGRNEPCPCGSGSKYKNCHGKNK